jgi:MtfA peptidase
VLGAEYAALRARVAAGEDGLIPAYGATDPAEFFAVISELYFERPAALRHEHGALYEQLRQVYRTDPSSWQ